ncbi:formimidoylglutamate deiminase [Rhodovibrio salinarum]|uniref:Formimidoylglutamate deiminase n=2 Tax=Rhodovibrio salinarum TaxID=1087 RepID=A0A934QJM4_9PROT|nr:formimidoylglutamate deiminase [Rhodovibrio salinarum]MBK1698091.1 formimidoylglutamate deiminase [Rhodovibrio salinarum]
MPAYFADRVWLPQGWATNVRLSVDSDPGLLTAVQPNTVSDDAIRLSGPVIPGVPNAHSHAFQRALAGLGERAGRFANWRTAMYRLANALTPEQLEAISAQAYVELLKGGYTSVAEFHYLHHGPHGQPYRDLPELSWRVLSAARHAGIAMTLLPVLYGHSDFGGEAPEPGQQRFVNEPERLLHLIQRIQEGTRDQPDVQLGLAPHSLRAVTPETLHSAVHGFRQLAPTAPIHMHVAEQPGEVDACQDRFRQRPVAWLLDQTDLVDDGWTFVHCTQALDGELEQLARRGVTVALCPTTEANLGDGVCAADHFAAWQGRLAIGSDSQVCRDAFAELRALDHSQRLRHGRRPGITPRQGQEGPGADLLTRAGLGGRNALGQKVGQLVPGARADLLVLDPEVAALAGVPDERLLDALLFQQPTGAVRDVMVGGRWVVQARQHHAEERILSDYRTVMAELMPQLG